MARLRNTFSALATLIRRRPTDEGAPGSTPGLHDGGNHISSMALRKAMQQLTAAIYIRETRGDVTTIRQLHAIAGLTQPEALLALGRLQQRGSVHIEHNLYDAFASEVTLTQTARAWIMQNRNREDC